MDLSFANLRTLLHSGLFHRWMVVSAASVLIEQALPFLFSVHLGYVPQSFRHVSVYYQYLGGSLITGSIILGLCQWLVIHRQFGRQRKPRSRWKRPLGSSWQITIIIASFITLFLNLLIDWPLYEGFRLSLVRMPGSLLYQALHTVNTGLGFGFAQWLFFKGRVYRAYRWIVAVVASQVLFALISLCCGNSLAIFPTLEDAATLSWLKHTFMAVFTLVLLMTTRGCLTGWVLVDFIEERTRNRFNPRG